MGVKAVARTGLLVFVGVSVVALIVKSLAPAPDNPAEYADPPSDGVVVTYFYSNTRCADCQRIEEQSHQALTAGFSGELQAGKLQWRMLNYERFENMRLARRYRIAMPMVVVARYENGSEQDWRRLDRVWDLRTDREAFIAYVQTETRGLLSESDNATESVE